MEKERVLLEKYKNSPGVYFLKHVNNSIVKFGSSKNISTRLKNP